jgi:subtilisin family serine protease
MANRLGRQRTGPMLVKNLLSSLLMIALSLAHFGSAPVAFARPVTLDAALARMLAQAENTQPFDVIVTLRDQAAVSQLDRATVSAALQRQATRTQADLLAYLHAQPVDQVQSVTSLWIDNALVLSASSRVIFELAQRSDIARIQLDQALAAPDRFTAPTAPASNLISLGVPAVWQRGITGKGVVVAVLDSGVDLLNPDLKAKWRGGSNSWFDPYGEHDAPVDLTGHGTQMLGVILGGSDQGLAIGLAPDARWIAARIFNDRGRATTSAIHKALQWVLDPDGDPNTPDAPQVVNNSWSLANPGCNSDFAADLQALRAAGILPVFAAGTSQPVSPANLPEAFAVGAIDDQSALLSDSAHGPSGCQSTDSVYPQLVAPGANIHTTDHFGAYIDTSGTSLAAAHVSGALALLLSARLHLSADEQAALLTGSAVDLGQAGPDNVFGYGRLNVAALINRAAPTTGSPGILGLIAAGLFSVGAAAIIYYRRRNRIVAATVRSSKDYPAGWLDLG